MKRNKTNYEPFLGELKKNLKRCNLSMRQFAKSARVSFADICYWSYGNKPIGKTSAQRLADTIAKHSTFTRKDREAFLAAAALTETRPLYNASQALARYFMNTLDRHLKVDGLAVSEVMEKKDEVVLVLNKGRKVYVQLLDDITTLPASSIYHLQVRMRFVAGR